MIFELRTYDLGPGKAPVYLEYFRTFGVGLVTQHLPMIGYWMVETGRLNRIEHMWAYESLYERDQCRAGLGQNKTWTNEFIPNAFVDVVAQENRFLKLVRSSASFENATLQRTKIHENQKSSTAMFATSLHGLSIGGQSLSEDGLIAEFKIISGNNLGQTLSLHGGVVDLLEMNTAAHCHEILRPLSLSPVH